MSSKLYEHRDLVIEEGKHVRELVFFHVGVCHLYKTTKIAGESMRLKVVTLKIGGWFGDYQIMLDLPSTWDLEAGSDKEFKNKHKINFMPPDHIMVYKIEADRFKRIIDQHPAMRSMVVTRSLFRRAYFMKTFKDNK